MSPNNTPQNVETPVETPVETQETQETQVTPHVFSLTDMLQSKGKKQVLGVAIQKIFSSGYDSRYIVQSANTISRQFARATADDQPIETREKWLNSLVSNITSTRHSGKGYNETVTLPMVKIVELAQKLAIVSGIVAEFDNVFKIEKSESTEDDDFEDFD